MGRCSHGQNLGDSQGRLQQRSIQLLSLSILQILSILSLLDEARWKPGGREPGWHRPSRSAPGALSGVQKDKERMKAQRQTISLLIYLCDHSTCMGSLAQWSRMQASVWPLPLHLCDLERVTSLTLSNLRCRRAAIVLSTCDLSLAILEVSYWGNTS